MKYLWIIFINCCAYAVSAQSLVDSVSERRTDYFMANQRHHILTLSDSKTKSRCVIDDKKHDLVIEYANSHFRTVRHLDSVCNFEKYPINCSPQDSIPTKYSNKEKWDWGNSMRVFDFKFKKQQIDRKDLLNKWFGNTDSVVSCREVYINDDSKPDLVFIRKELDEDTVIDILTHDVSFVPNGKIIFRIYVLINRGACYSIISKEQVSTQLKYLYLANFKVIDERFLYFSVDEARSGDSGVESLYIYEQKAD